MSHPALARGVLPACVVALVACGGHHPSTSPDSPAVVAPAVALRARPGDWTRFDYDARRSGSGPAQTGITAANVKSLRTRIVHIDGTVDASAIELHGINARGLRRDMIIVTTTYGKTIAIDPGTGARLWEYRPPTLRSYSGTYQVTTATPVSDRRFVYAPSPDGLIHKLDVSNGHEVRAGSWPARVTLLASREKIASPLNLSGSWVVVVTGGYIGDQQPYQGHVALIDRASGRLAHVFNTLCSNRRHLIAPSTCGASDSAIWGRAGAVIEPGSGRILIATGNAPWNGSTNWGDSALELTSDATHLAHTWTPRDQAQLGANDTDLGSTSPVLIAPGLIVQGGKDGLLRLIRLSGLGRGRLGGEIQSISTPGGDALYSAPAVSGRTMFVADGSGTAAYVLASGRLHVRWHNGAPGTSPVVAGGLLYVYDQESGRLDVYAPSSGRRLASLRAAGGHWNSPIAVGGRVILPVGNYMDHSSSGTLYIYHLPGR